MIAVSPTQRACDGVVPVVSAIFAKAPLLSESRTSKLDEPSLTVGLLPSTNVLRHAQLRAVVNSLELDFVHQSLDQLQSPTSPALAFELIDSLTVLARHIRGHRSEEH